MKSMVQRHLLVAVRRSYDAYQWRQLERNPDFRAAIGMIQSVSEFESVVALGKLLLASNWPERGRSRDSSARLA